MKDVNHCIKRTDRCDRSPLIAPECSMLSHQQLRFAAVLAIALACLPSDRLPIVRADPVCLPSLPVTPPLSLETLAKMTWTELEQLYRQSAPGSIPHGYLRGRAIYCSDKPLSRTRSALTHLLWHGKHFDEGECTLINQWCGFKAIKARVYPGPSWLDGQEAIIMDYQDQSIVWGDVRDEIREVAPGLYLGAMYRRRCPQPAFQMFFALTAERTCSP
jgi:hypothetical protein